MNDVERELNELGDVKSDDPRRKAITNKRHTEIYKTIVKLFSIAKYYRCQTFGIEKLNFKNNVEHSHYFNNMTNKLWCKETTIAYIEFQCRKHNMSYVRVNAAYSSMVGNILFRHLNMPDMCLAAFEIGRRAYETKQESKGNIITPYTDDFIYFFNKSLEEFNCEKDTKTVMDLLNAVKKSKVSYRVSIDDFINDDTKFKKLKYSEKSLVEWYDII